MRLFNFIKNIKNNITFVNKISESDIEQIKEDCSYYFSIDGNEKPFQRYTKDVYVEQNKFIKLRSHILDRKPRDIKIEIHNKLNNEFIKKFDWPVRNGVFAQRDIDIRGCVFLPIGKFNYVWSPKIYDLYPYLLKNKNIDITEIVNMYQNDNIEKCGNNEVSFNCKEYYILNLTNSVYKDMFR